MGYYASSCIHVWNQLTDAERIIFQGLLLLVIKMYINGNLYFELNITQLSLSIMIKKSKNN